MSESTQARSMSLPDRLRAAGVPDELVPRVAALATAEAIHLLLELRGDPAETGVSVDPAAPRGFGADWWTFKHAAFVTGVSRRTLERAVRRGEIRTNARNPRCVLLFADDVLRWRGMPSVSQRVA